MNEWIFYKLLLKPLFSVSCPLEAGASINQTLLTHLSRCWMSSPVEDCNSLSLLSWLTFPLLTQCQPQHHIHWRSLDAGQLFDCQQASHILGAQVLPECYHLRRTLLWTHWHVTPLTPSFNWNYSLGLVLNRTSISTRIGQDAAGLSGGLCLTLAWCNLLWFSTCPPKLFQCSLEHHCFNIIVVINNI